MGEFHCDDCYQPKGRCLPLCLKLQEERRYSERYKGLLSEWIAAAQSGGIEFGKVLQEPHPARLREAIRKAVENDRRLVTIYQAIRDLMRWSTDLEGCNERGHGKVTTCEVRNRLMDLQKKVEEA